jgi:antitoxin component YwqK of YwqJK toxin-antitoxin module
MHTRTVFILLGALALALAFPRHGDAEDRTETIVGAIGWKELDYRDNVLVEERSFDQDGVLLGERSFNPEALPVVNKRYIREDGRLVRIEASDAAGNPIGVMRYQYDRDGRLLVAKAEGIFGDEAVGVVSSSGGPQGSWIESARSTKVFAYDEEGRAILLQVMKEGKVARIERRNYGKKGFPSSIAIEDKTEGSSTTVTYDDAGRESSRKIEKDKGAEDETRYLYDASGRPVEERRVLGGHELALKRIYGKDGKLARTETRRDGSLVLAIRYDADSRTEELYEDGALFVKATYKGGRKVKDEFYVDGALSRSREYQ